MQLLLLLGVAFAIGAVMFALQNGDPVTVTFALWQFESPLAVVLLVTLGIGALIAAMVSSPAVLRRQWSNLRLRREISHLVRVNEDYVRKMEELEREVKLRRPDPAPDAPSPSHYLGLKHLVARFSRGPDVHL